jgi:periodic tryptophan protein 2
VVDGQEQGHEENRAQHICPGLSQNAAASDSWDSWIIRAFTLAFSYDGRYLASASEDGTSQIWDVQAGEHGTTLVVSKAVTAVAFAGRSYALILGCIDGSVTAWDIIKGKQIEAFLGNETRVNSVSISPTGSFVAAATGGDWAKPNAEPTIVLWSTRTKEIVHVMRGHKDSVHCLLFSEDGKLLISGSHDHSIKITP